MEVNVGYKIPPIHHPPPCFYLHGLLRLKNCISVNYENVNLTSLKKSYDVKGPSHNIFSATLLYNVLARYLAKCRLKPFKTLIFHCYVFLWKSIQLKITIKHVHEFYFSKCFINLIKFRTSS